MRRITFRNAMLAAAVVGTAGIGFGLAKLSIPLAIVFVILSLIINIVGWLDTR